MADVRKRSGQDRYRWGVDAERIAALMLSCKGYRILDRRFRTPAGEIDLIACRLAHFAFVEVKGRRCRPVTGEILTDRQALRVRAAARIWLAKQDMSSRLPACWSASLDLVVVCPWRWPLHVRDAF